MGNTGVLLLHGLFEHKGRQKINAEWFEKLNIQSYLIDLPGHGSDVSNKGDIGSWEENNAAVLNGFKNIQNVEEVIDELQKKLISGNLSIPDGLKRESFIDD